MSFGGKLSPLTPNNRSNLIILSRKEKIRKVIQILAVILHFIEVIVVYINHILLPPGVY